MIIKCTSTNLYPILPFVDDCKPPVVQDDPICLLHYYNLKIIIYYFHYNVMIGVKSKEKNSIIP